MSRDNKNSGAGAQRKVLGGASLLSLNYSGKTQDKKYDINSNLLSQRGRSMVELLGVLAVMGVLTIVALLGYRYAIDKGKANRIFNDVELAYVSATSQGARENGVLQETEFEPSSGYPIYTELISDEEGSIDIVLVKEVPQSVCEIVLDMSQGTEWLISSVEADTNYLYRLNECADQNALVFSLFDVDDFVYGCEKECPENMMCNVNDECVCAHGYEMNETTGECEEKTCDYALGFKKISLLY